MKSIIEFKKQAKILSKKRNLKLKDALDIVSKENDHSDWKSFRNSLDTFWYKSSSPFLTEWFTTHIEATKHKTTNGGYLLTYKGQYFVVDSEYINFLGLDPDADIWRLINYDVSSSNAFDKFYEYMKKNDIGFTE
jgi:hypothetical protein